MDAGTCAPVSSAEREIFCRLAGMALLLVFERVLSGVLLGYPSRLLLVREGRRVNAVANTPDCLPPCSRCQIIQSFVVHVA